MGIERKNEKVPVLPRFVSIKCACIIRLILSLQLIISTYDPSWLGLWVLITGTSARQSTMSASVAAILMLILRGSTFNWTPEPELSSSQTGSRSQKGVSEATNLPPLRQPWAETGTAQARPASPGLMARSYSAKYWLLRIMSTHLAPGLSRIFANRWKRVAKD